MLSDSTQGDEMKKSDEDSTVSGAGTSGQTSPTKATRKRTLSIALWAVQVLRARSRLRTRVGGEPHVAGEEASIDGIERRNHGRA